MKKLLFVLILTIPSMVFGQSMNIKWEDRDGREFSINSHSGKFTYSMVSGDNLEYNSNNQYDYRNTGPSGTIRTIGNVEIVYNSDNRYDYNNIGPSGSIRTVGNLKIVYNIDNQYDYNNTGPSGSIRKTTGSVN